MAARNIGLDELSAALRAANVNTPVGTLDGPRQTLTLQANRQLRNAAEFAELIVANRNGSPVRLKDVAQVIDSLETLKSWATLNGENSITLAVLRQACGERLHFTAADGGALHYRQTGSVLPQATFDACRDSHAILHGAAGLPGITYPDGTEAVRDFTLEAPTGKTTVLGGIRRMLDDAALQRTERAGRQLQRSAGQHAHRDLRTGIQKAAANQSPIGIQHIG